MVGSCLVSGAALGAAFELLCRTLIHVSRDITCFESELNNLKSTLDSVDTIFQDIRSYIQIISLDNHTQQEVESFVVQLIKGEKLIHKCSKVKWNPFKRWHYSKKLKKLEASLSKFFQINVAAFHFRESKKVLVTVSRLEEKVNDLVAKTNTPQVLLMVDSHDDDDDTNKVICMEAEDDDKTINDDDHGDLDRTSTIFSALEEVPILHIYGS